MKFFNPKKYRVVEEYDRILNKTFFYAQVSYFYGIPGTWRLLEFTSRRYTTMEAIKNEIKYHMQGDGIKYHKV